MKKVGLLLVIGLMMFTLVAHVKAGDLRNVVLVAVRTDGADLDDICIPEFDGSCDVTDPTGIYHVNCTMGAGVDYPFDYDMTKITHFARITCTRPVPQTANPLVPVDVIVGEIKTARLQGRSWLNNVTHERIVSIDGGYNRQNDFALSAKTYQRPLISDDLYSVTHEARLSLPHGWVWYALPAGCVNSADRVASCSLESAPFYFAPNPGEPADRG